MWLADLWVWGIGVINNVPFRFGNINKKEWKNPKEQHFSWYYCEVQGQYLSYFQGQSQETILKE